MAKARNSGRYDVHILLSSGAYERIESCREKLGLNRSAMIELMASQFDPDAVTDLRTLNASVEFPGASGGSKEDKE